MSAVRESGGGGWLSWLIRSKKSRASVVSSPRLAEVDARAVALKASDEARGPATHDPAAADVTSATAAPTEPMAPATAAEAPAVPTAALVQNVEESPTPAIPDLLEASAFSAPASPDSAPDEDQSQSETGANILAALVAELGAGAAYTHVFAPDFVPYSVGKGMEQALIADGSGFTLLRIARGDEKAASSGNTGGYSVRLPDEIEKAASGRPIELRLLARSMNAAEGRIACAYSTNDVGNSEWRPLAFGAEWEIRSFKYQVPPMKHGNGDFVGLLPPPNSEPVTEILGFAIEIAS